MLKPRSTGIAAFGNDKLQNFRRQLCVQRVFPGLEKLMVMNTLFSPVAGLVVQDVGVLVRRFVARTVQDAARVRVARRKQVANLADEIAYNNHDVDDGLRAGLVGIDRLQGTIAFGEAYAEVVARWPALGERRAVHETVRRMIDRQVADLADGTRLSHDQKSHHSYSRHIVAEVEVEEPIKGVLVRQQWG